MKKTNQTPATVDEYIAAFPKEVQQKLLAIRKTISTAAPKATEAVSYGIPAYKYNGKPMVYFGAFKNHIGFYATPSGHAAFKDELSKYTQGKGSVQFPAGEPLPLGLIRRIVLFRKKLCTQQSVASSTFHAWVN